MREGGLIYFTFAMLIMLTVLLEYIDLWYKYLAKHFLFNNYAGVMLDVFSYLLCWDNRRDPRLVAQEISAFREIITIQCGCSDVF